MKKSTLLAIILAVVFSPLAVQAQAPRPAGSVAIIDLTYIFKHHKRFNELTAAMRQDVERAEQALNVDRGNKERIAQLTCVCGQLRNKVDELVAGDIGATVKLKDGGSFSGKVKTSDATAITLEGDNGEVRYFEPAVLVAPTKEDLIRPVEKAKLFAPRELDIQPRKR